ncbi:hypothetical protein ACA910_000396 [Epithemia clementina (nom. ined.)]
MASAGLGMSVSPPKKVAVIGATGRLGRIAVQKLVDDGISCKILLRNNHHHHANDKQSEDATTSSSSQNSPLVLSPKSSKEEVVAYLTSLPNVEIVSGDVGNVQALKELLQDCDACLALYGATRRSKLSDLWNNQEAEEDPTHAKQINYKGVINILEAAKASGGSCKRIVRITGKGEDPTSIFSILINMLGSMAKAWNYEGEQALRSQTDVEYTIIRPGVMSEQGPVDEKNDTKQSSSDYSNKYQLVLADNGGDLKVSKIRYDDIASLCIESLGYSNAGRCTLTAMTRDPNSSSDQDNSNKDEIGAASSWGPLLAKVQSDRRVFPADMFQQHKDAVQGALIKIGVVTAVLCAVLLKALFGAMFG